MKVRSMALSRDQIKFISRKFFKCSEAEAEKLWAACANKNIITVQRVSHFFSQMAYESGKFRYKTEIADGSAYEYRSDLGNTRPGYGKKYKGAGGLQLTGYYNYKEFADDQNDPDILKYGATYVGTKYFFESAAFFWEKNNLNQLCDQASTNVRTITQKINGGQNGRAQREEYFEEIKDIAYKRYFEDLKNRAPRSANINSYEVCPGTSGTFGSVENKGCTIMPVGDGVGVGYKSKRGNSVGAGVNRRGNATIQVTIPIPCSIM